MPCHDENTKTALHLAKDLVHQLCHIETLITARKQAYANLGRAISQLQIEKPSAQPTNAPAETAGKAG